MPWQAQFNDIVKRETGLAYSITYFDESHKLSEDYFGTVVTDDTIRQVAIDKIAQLSRADSAKSSITLAPGSLIDLTPPTVKTDPPSNADIARSAFFVAYRKVQGLQRALAAGNASIQQAAVDDAIAAWNKLPYLTEYESSL